MSKIVIHNLESTQKLDEEQRRSIRGGEGYLLSDIQLHNMGFDNIVKQRWEREAEEENTDIHGNHGCGC